MIHCAKGLFPIVVTVSKGGQNQRGVQNRNDQSESLSPGSCKVSGDDLEMSIEETIVTIHRNVFPDPEHTLPFIFMFSFFFLILYLDKIVLDRVNNFAKYHS